ncbi:MAG: hypothetical protein ACRC2O_02555, partial [Chitinophagaceae bacterium]
MRTFIFFTVLMGISICGFAQMSPLSKAVMLNDHQQPFIPRPEQDKVSLQKLAALEKKTGKKPNIVWFIIDDMGWGDPGCYG